MNPLIFLNLAGRIAGRLVQSPSVSVTPTARPIVIESVREAIAADPVLKNELNAEKPIQSRVLWGNFVAGLGRCRRQSSGFCLSSLCWVSWTSLRSISSAMALTLRFKA
ncbi:hypothetical protein [Microvirga sp. P5_D2]